VFDTVIDDVANGQYLSTSLSKFNNLFGDFAINIIRVGESGGILSQNLSYLADELAKKQALRRKVTGALVYPVFISIATLGVTGMLTAYIFPKLMPIFTNLHVDLPITTRALIATSSYLRNWGLYTLLAVIAMVIIYSILRRKVYLVRIWSDWVVLKFPLTGTVARNYNLVNFCRTMGLLLSSGVTLADAVTITGQTTRNVMYAEACRRLAASVTKGEAPSRALLRMSSLFPPMVANMVHIGETTGNLADTFIYLSEMYEGEVDEGTKNLSSAIEPALMILMGLLVGLIAVSIITPMYGITQHLQTR
jgi:type II secretory pathway component PulF